MSCCLDNLYYIYFSNDSNQISNPCKQQHVLEKMVNFFVGCLHVLFTLADHINCIHMPIVRFLRYPEGQFKQQLCNIGFGRSSRLKGKVITWGLLNGIWSEVVFSQKGQQSKQKPSKASAFYIIAWAFVLKDACFSVEKVSLKKEKKKKTVHMRQGLG